MEAKTMKERIEAYKHLMNDIQVMAGREPIDIFEGKDDTEIEAGFICTIKNYGDWLVEIYKMNAIIEEKYEEPAVTMKGVN